MKKILMKVILLFIFLIHSFSQSTSLDVTENMQNDNTAIGAKADRRPDAQLAMSVSYYPVTAGDVYTLAFSAGGSPVQFTIPIDSTYKIRVANLGVISCAGLTYLQLKSQVEAIVQRNYPMGGVQFVLTAPSTFLVSISGEVTTTVEQEAWSLTRLSTFAGQYFTPYASMRNITIQSANGKSRTYDLFKAKRDGDLSQDPFLRPNDKIIVNRLERKVTISGAVERPGTYELLTGENLKELIEKYGAGLDINADTSRITITRTVDSTDAGGNQLYLDSNAISSDYVLQHLDTVIIGSKKELLPYITLEGIIKNPSSDTLSSSDNSKEMSETTSYKTVVKFHEGENYATLVRRISNMFTTYSDLQKAYILRSNNKIALNLEEILYNADFKSPYTAQDKDKLVIPFAQSFANKIIITGEVTAVTEKNAWPLQHLSSLIADLLTPYSSTRHITVIDVAGSSTEYDLFLAQRYGDMSQDPYIQSGDKIIVNRLERKVTISGAVERPGTYELLTGENLKELIEKYGAGLAPLADTSRIELYRSITGRESSGRKSYMNYENIVANTPLLCYDSIYISSYKDLLPQIFVEGAVGNVEKEDTNVVNRIVATFNNGEDYAYFVRRNRAWFSSVSDLKSAYVIRGEEKIPLDLTKMLYDASYYANIEMKADDTLYIPFVQYFVSVAGAVNNPGRYPYMLDRTWEYYIGLAGGFTEANAHDSIELYDINNKKYSKNDPITPETTITAKRNSFFYKWSRYAPTITTVLSIVVSALSIYVTAQTL